MPTLLRIDASAQLEERSLTRHLTGIFTRTFLANAPETKVITRDVGLNPIAAIDQEFIHAAFTPPEEREPWMNARLALSDELIEEVEASDILVMGAPMYNYGMPTALKGWIDQVARIGKTFSFDLARGDTPIEPILSGKRLVVLSARGEFGFAQGGVRAHLNTLDPGLAACAHYFGVKPEHIDTIAIEYQEFKDDRHRTSVEMAEARTGDLAADLAAELAGAATQAA